METKELENLFVRASQLNEDKAGYSTSEEWHKKRMISGIKAFKRKALGLCGRTAIKSLDAMAQLLYETGIVFSVEKGRTITPSLAGQTIGYYAPGNHYKIEISFNEVVDACGQKAYRIDYSTYGKAI